MAVTTPLMGINFAHATTPLRDVISANNFNIGTGSISGGGYLCDTTGETGYLTLTASQQPPAWDCTIHVRCAHASGGYNSLVGVKKGTGNATMIGRFQTGGTFNSVQSNTGGGSTISSSSYGTVVRSGTTTDYTVTTDYFLRFKSASDSSQGRINSAVFVTDGSASASTTAPTYSTARFYAGCDPGDIGNGRMKTFQMGFWNINLTDAECNEIVTDPVAAYLSTYNNPKRKKFFISMYNGVPPMGSVGKAILIPGPAFIDDGSGSTGGSSREDAFWRNRRRVR